MKLINEIKSLLEFKFKTPEGGLNNVHTHEAEKNDKGNGKTTSTSKGPSHTHLIKFNEIIPVKAAGELHGHRDLGKRPITDGEPEGDGNGEAPEMGEQANDGTLYKLKTELELKQKGSKFVFPKGTLVALMPVGRKFSAANSHTKTTVDALTGSISPSVVKKLLKASTEVGSLVKNKKLINKKFNQNMIAGPIGNLLR